MHVDQNKILGCTVGAAAADAMGAATEVRTQQQIKDYFGGWVTTFQNRLRTRLGAAMKRGCARMILFRRSTSWMRCCAISVKSATKRCAKLSSSGWITRTTPTLPARRRVRQ